MRISPGGMTGCMAWITLVVIVTAACALFLNQCEPFRHAGTVVSNRSLQSREQGQTERDGRVRSDGRPSSNVTNRSTVPERETEPSPSTEE